MKIASMAERIYTVFARWPREVRLFTVEWEMIENEAEALKAVKETENAVLVIRNDPDIPRTNVSEDIARIWLRELMERGDDLIRRKFPLSLENIFQTIKS